jgi:hypothetical protein
VSRRLVSIAVEWDNVRLAEADRSLRMLAQLNAQARAIDAPVEVIVCHNEREIDANALCSVLRQRLTVPWKLEATGGCEYYELKNRAQHRRTGVASGAEWHPALRPARARPRTRRPSDGPAGTGDTA